MYWRYFMWNFAGRQNDLQGSGEIEHGNWITGIKFIDNIIVGNQDLLPKELKENKGHNVFPLPPLPLGIIGLLWRALPRPNRYQRSSGWCSSFMTSIAIVLAKPDAESARERLCMPVRSTASAIWIGIGLWQALSACCSTTSQIERGSPLQPSVSAARLLVPIQNGKPNTDDHDRGGSRNATLRTGQNHLMSLQEAGNPIISAGDKSTRSLG